MGPDHQRSRDLGEVHDKTAPRRHRILGPTIPRDFHAVPRDHVARFRPVHQDASLPPVDRREPQFHADETVLVVPDPRLRRALHDATRTEYFFAMISMTLMA